MKKALLLIAVVAVFASCKKDEEPLKVTTNIELFYEKTETVKATHQCTYKSSDEAIATVNSSGLVTAHRVGECKVTASSTLTSESAYCTVKVIPRSNLYAIPCLLRYESPATIMGSETRKFKQYTTNGLIYEGENSNVRLVMYMFEANMMKSAAVLLKTTGTVEAEAQQYLEERFDYFGEIDYKAYAYTDGDLMMVLNNDATLGLNVVYFWNDTKADPISRYKAIISSRTILENGEKVK